MMISPSVRTVLAGLVLSNLCLADDASAVGGFRSELWRMEYHEKDDKAQQNGDKDDEGEEDGSVSKLDVNLSRRVVGDMLSSSVAKDALEVSAPGQVDMHDLGSETPFADWKVDEGASGLNSHRPFQRATGWQLSQAGTGDGGTEPLSNGPSMVTFMVAIVACVVVTGALFSGRE
jgi:hypothetical protein